MKKLPYWAGLVYVTQIALMFAISVFAGLGTGFLLDNLFKTLPVFTLIGLGAGVIAAFVGVYRFATREDS